MDQTSPIHVVIPGRKEPLLLKDFKDIMGFEYTSCLIFKNEGLLKRVMKRVKKYPLDNRISVERKWLGAYYKPFLNAGFIPAVQIQFINPKMGYGLFAGQRFNKGDFIGEYTGEVKRSLFFKTIANPYVGEYALGGRDPVRFVIDAKLKGNYTRFINHSDNPNASAITVISGDLLHVVIFAEKQIQSGVEITFDYGPNYWKRRTKN